jgi:hypothetical protein
MASTLADGEEEFSSGESWRFLCEEAPTTSSSATSSSVGKVVAAAADYHRGVSVRTTPPHCTLFYCCCLHTHTNTHTRKHTHTHTHTHAADCGVLAVADRHERHKGAETTSVKVLDVVALVPAEPPWILKNVNTHCAMELPPTWYKAFMVRCVCPVYCVLCTNAGYPTSWTATGARWVCSQRNQHHVAAHSHKGKRKTTHTGTAESAVID